MGSSTAPHDEGWARESDSAGSEFISETSSEYDALLTDLRAGAHPEPARAPVPRLLSFASKSPAAPVPDIPLPQTLVQDGWRAGAEARVRRGLQLDPRALWAVLAVLVVVGATAWPFLRWRNTSLVLAPSMASDSVSELTSEPIVPSAPVAPQMTLPRRLADASPVAEPAARPANVVAPPAAQAAGQAPAPVARAPVSAVSAARTTAVPTAGATGQLTFQVPFEMQVFVDGQLVGTTRSARLPAPAGARTLTFVASAFAFEASLTADVQAGRTTAVSVPIPDGRVSFNAEPWAEVVVNGTSLGITPLANVAVPIGAREVIWRHPTLGERRSTVVVSAGGPARASIDMRVSP